MSEKTIDIQHHTDPIGDLPKPRGPKVVEFHDAEKTIGTMVDFEIVEQLIRGWGLRYTANQECEQIISHVREGLKLATPKS